MVSRFELYFSIGGAVLTAGMAWGSFSQRVDALEKRPDLSADVAVVKDQVQTISQDVREIRRMLSTRR